MHRRYESLFPESLYNDEKEARRNLKKCYEHIHRCSICFKLFGSDSGEVKRICPVCEEDKRRETRHKKKIYKAKNIE